MRKNPVRLKEKRKDARFKINLPMGIHLGEARSKRGNGQTKDISEGGLGSALEDALVLNGGQPAWLDLQKARTGLKIPAKVTWAKQGKKYSKAGFQFDGLSLEQERELKKFLSLLDDYLKFHYEKWLQEHPLEKAQKQVYVEFFADKLKYFIQQLDILEKSLKKGVPSVETIQKNIFELSNWIVQEGEFLLGVLDHPLAARNVKELFRRMIGGWIYESQMMHRGFSKPRGYPGDYLIIEWVYEGNILSEGMGARFDRYFLDNPYAVAVRNRKDYMRYILQEFSRNPAANPLKVLNLACGSCREVRELAVLDAVSSGFAFSCLDQDEEALSFAKERMVTRADFKVQFIGADILALIRSTEKKEEIGLFDIIYSIGLADYFTDRLLKAFIKWCWAHLELGGTLVLAHKDRDHYRPLPPAWFCDWNFNPRNENEFLKLFQGAGIPKENLRVEREPTGVIFFVKATKR